jgi:hypothetical protein
MFLPPYCCTSTRPGVRSWKRGYAADVTPKRPFGTLYFGKRLPQMTRDDQFGITGDSGEPCKNGKVGICGTPSSCKTSTVTGACTGRKKLDGQNFFEAPVKPRRG